MNAILPIFATCKFKIGKGYKSIQLRSHFLRIDDGCDKQHTTEAAIMNDVKQIFLQQHHDIPVFTDHTRFERSCRKARPSIGLVPAANAAMMHQHLASKLRVCPFTAHDKDAYPGNRVITSKGGEKLNSLAGSLGQNQPFHTDAASHGPQWLADLLLTYVRARKNCGGLLGLVSLEQLLDRLTGSAIHLMLNTDVEVERDLGVRKSVYRGPMLIARGRNEYSFRFRFDSVAQMRCVDIDPLKRRDGDQLIKWIAAELEAIPRTIVKPAAGVMVYLTQSGPAERCFLHCRTEGTAPQNRLALRDWLNYTAQ